MGVTGPRRVVVEIGELVLDGFPAADRDLVAASFRRELTRLLAGPLSGVFESTVDGSVDVAVTAAAPTPDLSSRRLGVQLARTVHATLDGAG
jgi:hypothetical protein